jgi:hypothetical protein
MSPWVVTRAWALPAPQGASSTSSLHRAVTSWQSQCPHWPTQRAAIVLTRTGTVASNLKGMLGKEPDMDWDGTEGQTKQATSKIKERGVRPCNGELLG